MPHLGSRTLHIIQDSTFPGNSRPTPRVKGRLAKPKPNVRGIPLPGIGDTPRQDLSCESTPNIALHTFRVWTPLHTLHLRKVGERAHGVAVLQGTSYLSVAFMLSSQQLNTRGDRLHGCGHRPTDRRIDRSGLHPSTPNHNKMDLQSATSQLQS